MTQSGQSTTAVCYDPRMRTSSLSSGTVMSAIVLLTINACSRSHDDASTDTLVSVNQPRDEFKLYSSSSLVEVRNFADLPEGLRAILARGKYAVGGEGPEGRCCMFMVAGVSRSSAIVEYEIFGYVPSYQAAAFVQAKNGWVRAGEWGIEPASTLVALEGLTSRPPDFR
jgi:hypothetical protein